MQPPAGTAGDVRPGRAAAAHAPWAWAGALALLLHGLVLHLTWPDTSRGRSAAARPPPELRAVQLVAVPRSARDAPTSVPQPADAPAPAAPEPRLAAQRAQSPGGRAAAAPHRLAGKWPASADPVPDPGPVPAPAGTEAAARQRLAPQPDGSAPPAAASMPADEADEPLAPPQALRELALRPLPRYAASLPEPFKLHLSVQRGAFRGEGELRFEQEPDGSYRLQLHLQGPARPMWEQSSAGRTGAQGLEPGQFADRRRGRRIGQAQFDRDQGEVRFGARAPALPLAEGAQDRLSWLVQLGAVLRADAALRRTGAIVWLPVYSARGDIQLWRFENQGERTLTLDDGITRATWQLTRMPERLYDTQVEVWIDPHAQFQPARIQLTHWPSGDRLQLDRRNAPTTP